MSGEKSKPICHNGKGLAPMLSCSVEVSSTVVTFMLVIMMLWKGWSN